MTFRRRLTLYGTAMAAVTTLALWVVLILLTGLGARSDQRSALETASLETVERWTGDGRPDQLPPTDVSEPADILVSTVRGNGRLDQPITVDGESIVIPEQALVDALGDGHRFETVTVGESTVRLSIRPLPDLSGADFVAALQSSTVAESAVEELVPALVVASIVILIAAYRASSLVAGRAITPLEQISAHSSHVTETGDTSRTLDVGRRGREIDDVVASLNTMVTQLARSRDRTAATLEAQRRFVANASHELRTPLTTIRTNASFLKNHPDADEPDRLAAAQDIGAEAERLARMTDDLLALARADAEAPVARTGRVDLADLAGDVRRLTDSGDRVLRLLGSQAVVDGDRDELLRLIRILVDNALVHGEGSVSIETGVQGGSAILTVSDEGRGVHPAERTAVFERFHRGAGATGRPGSGLGLAIARQIVEDHGGSISIDDADGAVILVELPRG